MVRLTRIYTRGGDNGQTSLGDGSRVPKHSVRVAAFGTVDEANAAIGLARLHVDAAADADADAMLGRIQNDLFDLGADLCTPEDGRRGADKGNAGALRILAAQVERLEHEIDAMNATLRPLDSFILPAAAPPPPICTWRAPSPAAPSAWSASWPQPKGSTPKRSNT